MSDRPTLHDIAALPYSKTVEAMRQFYDPNWQTGSATNDGPRWKVRVEYTRTVEDEDVFEVEAASEDEAKKRARAIFREEHCSDDEIEFVEVERLDA